MNPSSELCGREADLTAGCTSEWVVTSSYGGAAYKMYCTSGVRVQFTDQNSKEQMDKNDVIKIWHNKAGGQRDIFTYENRHPQWSKGILASKKGVQRAEHPYYALLLKCHPFELQPQYMLNIVGPTLIGCMVPVVHFNLSSSIAKMLCSCTVSRGNNSQMPSHYQLSLLFKKKS